MKKVAILQSNYIPWKGYFDLINMVDEFILYDDMQYTRRDWRNRNKIKTPQGLKWLTIPVEVKGKFFQKINETKISDKKWGKRHWTQIVQNYKNAHYFKEYKDLFEELYRNNNEIYLSAVNMKFLHAINNILGIHTTIKDSSEFKLIDGKSERLLGICKDCQADVYLSGPAAKGYLDTQLFQNEGIAVEWIDYSGYGQYTQLYPPFEHGVSVIDLIFNEGSNATAWMQSFHTSSFPKITKRFF